LTIFPLPSETVKDFTLPDSLAVAFSDQLSAFSFFKRLFADC
jgi:hypothetical protein